MRAAPAVAVVVAALAGAPAAPAAAEPQRPEGAPATCRQQSSARFPRSARDLVVGPLVLVGARAPTPAGVVARHGGQKYPAVVLAGHRVTVELPRSVGRSAALLYADDHRRRPDGPRAVRDGHRVVAFRACPRRRAASRYGGRRATFWSGFVLTTRPRCLTLRVWVDGEDSPRRRRIALGRPCP
jgi:hypothetical protein